MKNFIYAAKGFRTFVFPADNQADAIGLINHLQGQGLTAWGGTLSKANAKDGFRVTVIDKPGRAEQRRLDANAADYRD